MPESKQRRELLEPTVYLAIDAVVLVGSFLLTYWLRFHSGLILVPLGIPPLGPYLLASLVIVLVFLAIFYGQGLYSARGGRRVERDFVELFRGVVLGSLLVLALTFFVRAMTFSRWFFGLFFWISWVGLCVGRVAARRVLARILHRGLRRTRLLLVGSNPMRERMLRTMRELPGLALEPIGWLRVIGEADPGPSRAAPPLLAAGEPPAAEDPPPDLPCLGEVGDVREVVEARAVDRVVLTLRFDQLPLITRVAASLANLTTEVQWVPDLSELHTSKLRLREVAGIPFISVREVALSGADRIVKRTCDLVVSAVALVALSPLLAAIAVAVALTSRGPVIYRQARVGRDGREFTMAKFRTMRLDAEAQSGPVWAQVVDSRVTPLGRHLRRWSLDELPQFWNVLRGDMSLVGPRPERRVFVEQFSLEMPRYFERHRVKSGLTGWAQVNGLRGNTSIEDRTLYDLHYVENWSLWLDLRILLMTVHHVLRGENAY
ncbi:MAG TPA: undecaprenyl-phosphate glucose phosphotransferase [Candidatus Krumholzibacteria bacterium]|nr:undecaprenyl-phosphate glucose phosphotransferase [Candidatus Krumholzibacteria bacterium]HPD72733.1 undecaprenyl-phosphate glucose phosphotransferase [Candidatus Krumholzibacteria bacterium]HRY40335.1 undecaprenyl-phosphate glucose phosphotransferase [Candidatus Krumholzibacteria bacterium]